MKKDKFLGEEVNLFLIKKGVETPQIKNDLTTDEKRRSIANHFYSIMGALGLDLSDDSLVDTPNRVAKMFVDEMFYGLNYNNFPKCTAVDNKMKYDEMVTVDKISLSSSCEHHLVIGLSKINRIVDFFAKRPQIQERLTEQIFFALSYILETEDIAVKIKATHYCVKARGVKDVTSNTTTTKLGGAFKDPIAKNEFLLLTT